MGFELGRDAWAHLTGLGVGLLLMGVVHAQTPALVTVDSGPLAGRESNGVRAFLGVPYAAPPVDAWRWKAPQPVTPWKTVRDAHEFGAACPQPDDRMYGLTPKPQSEDCLFLNVWTPAAEHSKSGKPWPVMVWFHGGANRMGAGSIPFYDGSKLAQREVVVVTVNYRLGYLGFFAHDGLDAEHEGGNYALMDQIAALKWVQRNIAAFGGDPQRVTAFGESAGGADILYLMTSAAAQGLFQQAIVQSGGGWNKPPTREAMKKKVAKNLEAVGVSGPLDAAALRALKPAQLIEALAKSTDIGFGPFQDGLTTSEAPMKAFAEGRAAKIPLIIGSNDWEGSLTKFRGTGFLGKLLARIPPFMSWYPNRDTTAAEREVLMFRDLVFAAPARWLAAAQSKQASTWLYSFKYVTSGLRGKVPGAGHAAEIAYVFDTVGVTPKSAAQSNDEDRRLATALTDCWAAFARTGKPDCTLSPWEAYDPSSDRILIIDRAPHQAAHPEAKALDGAVEWFGPGSLLGG